MAGIPELAHKTHATAKALTAKQTQQRLIVINRIFAMGTDIFSHLINYYRSIRCPAKDDK